ncbi:MAG: F0F1 ATP synthase subunit delta [Actinobacteria bacterium]|nr:F0F1 ATP synthase subunit delta [Actinomycetota bacterium]
MRGASRAAVAAAQDELAAAVRGDPAAATAIGDELFGVTSLLDSEPALRRALTDATSPAGARTGLVRGLLGGRVGRATLDLVAGMVSSRWSAPRDLASAAERLAVMATAAAADSAGQLDDLEDELFRFGRIVAGQPELGAARASPLLPADRKRGLLDALLADRVSPAALRLISEVAVHPRGRSLVESLEEYARLAAAWRQRLVAVVRVAAALSSGQRDRLAAALEAAYGRGIHLNIVVDPAVVGGMSVQIGDEFIDGSVASRLAALRRRLAA